MKNICNFAGESLSAYSLQAFPCKKRLTHFFEYSRAHPEHQHLHICTFAHLHICTFAHLHICTFATYFFNPTLPSSSTPTWSLSIIHCRVSMILSRPMAIRSNSVSGFSGPSPSTAAISSRIRLNSSCRRTVLFFHGIYHIPHRQGIRFRQNIQAGSGSGICPLMRHIAAWLCPFGISFLPVLVIFS